MISGRAPLDAVAVYAALTVGCGGEPRDRFDAGADATTNDGALGFGDGAVSDAAWSDDVASVVLEAGAPFLCVDCICNGADHYCFGMAEGDWMHPFLALDGGFGDASVCNSDSGRPFCIDTPAQCLPSPSCSCLLASIRIPGCDCRLDPTGDGLLVGCLLP